MKRPNQIPCVFRGAFVREQVDPRIKEAWRGQVPWGDLRKTWKSQHCTLVNPTGQPEDCPYPEEDCALAFLQCVLSVLDADRPMALFRVRAKIRGAERADNKPLAREGAQTRRVGDLHGQRGPDTPPADVPGVPGVTPAYLPDAPVRPTQIGALLGAFDFGPRQGRAHDGQEGTR